MPHILIIDDDVELSDHLKKFLSFERIALFLLRMMVFSG